MILYDGIEKGFPLAVLEVVIGEIYDCKIC